MKLSYNWIKEHVDFKGTPTDLAAALTSHGLKVEAVKELKEFADYLLEIEVTSNRPDCLSIIGLARETSAIAKAKFRPHKIESLKGISELKPKDFFKIKIEAPDECGQYTGRLIFGVKVGESPLWLKNRISAMGLRPVNNIVDITNFVLLEYGQPLHAFDYKKIKGGQVIVRLAKKGETLITIDGAALTLSENDLVIADNTKPIALAGVMGGKEAEISMDTTDVFLESAQFSPLLVRKTSAKFGIVTESSYRFERGIDQSGIGLASDRATSLFLEVAGAGKVTNLVIEGKKRMKARKVILRPERLNQILGISLSNHKAIDILDSLSFVTKKLKTGIEAEIPSWRNDVREEIDLIEEVARIYGYDKIPSTLPQIQLSSAPEDKKYDTVHTLRRYLKSAGLSEVISYTLISQTELKKTGHAMEGVV
ncbi:MAG: phenylalanine--tRNA ligase subunit beta, partial [Candidatus Omnitrophica bacterium]|nr:phenylalanine--tRNA ligase subunit beta [Candidatus Omnitrophota bacterium]